TDKGWRFALSTIVVPRQVNRVGSTGAWFGAADTGLPPSYFPAQKWYVAARLDLRGGLHHVFAGPGTAHRSALLPERTQRVVTQRHGAPGFRHRIALRRRA